MERFSNGRAPLVLKRRRHFGPYIQLASLTVMVLITRYTDYDVTRSESDQRVTWPAVTFIFLSHFFPPPPSTNCRRRRRLWHTPSWTRQLYIPIVSCSVVTSGLIVEIRSPVNQTIYTDRFRCCRLCPDTHRPLYTRPIHRPTWMTSIHIDEQHSSPLRARSSLWLCQLSTVLVSWRLRSVYGITLIFDPELEGGLEINGFRK